MKDAIRWALVLSALVHVVIQALSCWEAAVAWHRGFRTDQFEARWWRKRYAGALGVSHPSGSPSLTGLYLAVVMPLAPYPLWPVFLLGLWWASSWLSIAALVASWALLGGRW